jgi:hypothetical protein
VSIAGTQNGHSHRIVDDTYPTYRQERQRLRSRYPGLDIAEEAVRWELARTELFSRHVAGLSWVRETIAGVGVPRLYFYFTIERRRVCLRWVHAPDSKFSRFRPDDDFPF